jgi:hypothetical protein
MSEKMRSEIKHYILHSTACTIAFILVCGCNSAQNSTGNNRIGSFVYSSSDLEKMMTKPASMGEYLPSQGGNPVQKTEMDSDDDFGIILPTWNSLGSDYLSEMEHFRKKWLAIFGAEDRVVPTNESVKNINYYMSLSGNPDCNIAVIPGMGHVPVDIKTKERINFDYLIINWLNRRVMKGE